MNKRLRVGVVGAGMVSTFHLRGWRALAEHVELVAIADLDPTRAAARAAEFGVARCWPGLAEMLAGERLDAVDIATPPASHAADCLVATDAGVAVLCQKPLAPNLALATALVEAIGTRVRLMVHENWRFRPHYRQVQRWLAEGPVGALRGGRLSTCSRGLLPDADVRRPALVRQPLLATLPRMMVAETLVHHLDVAHWLAGAGTVLGATLRRDVSQIAGESAATIAVQR